MSTVPEQMKYTVTDFTVKPGQRVQITFKNGDLMQHNIVIGRPGTRDAIAVQVTAMATATDAAERNYIPPTPDVLFYTKLVDPGQSIVLDFVAPMQPGDYPYGCTFPGHWLTMQGTMKVAP
jgi:azurin